MKRFGALRRNNERGFQTLGIVEKRDQKSDLSGFQWTYRIFFSAKSEYHKSLVDT